MKTLKKLLTAIGFAASCLYASAIDYTTIQLPFSTLAANTTTNLGLGWQNILTNTTTSSGWNTSSNAFITTTNTVTTTNTLYSDFSAVNQSKVPIHLEFNNSNSSATSNLVYVVSKSNYGGHFPTNGAAVVSITNAASGTTLMVYEDVIDMTGFNYGRIIQMRWENSGTGTLTNGVFAKGEKRTPNL